MCIRDRIHPVPVPKLITSIESFCLNILLAPLPIASTSGTFINLMPLISSEKSKDFPPLIPIVFMLL